MYLKVKNFSQSDGIADYKTLDINKFLSGSQVYDFENNVCLIATTEDNFTSHTDITELTESEYNEQRAIINDSSSDEMTTLKNELENQKQALAELMMYVATLTPTV